MNVLMSYYRYMAFKEFFFSDIFQSTSKGRTDQCTFSRYTVMPRVTILFDNPWKSKRKPNFCASELFLCTLPLLQREASANALTLPILGSLLQQWPWLWQDPEGPDSRGTHEAVWMACARSIKTTTQCFGTKDSWLTLTSPSLNYL